MEAVLESDGLRVGMGLGAILRWLSRWLPVEQTPKLVNKGQGARWDQDLPPWGLASISSLESGWGLGAPQAPQGPVHNSRPVSQASAPSGPGKRGRQYLPWGQTPEISAQAGGVRVRGCWEAGGPPYPPAEAWGCYLHGREEERFGVR